MERLLIASIVAAGTLSCAIADRPRPVQAGFWFDSVSYDLIERGGPLTASEIALVQDAALDELRNAFAGIAVRFSHRRDTRYTVTVVQHLYDLRLRRTHEVYGSARSMRGFGGHAEVNFFAVASSATAYAPAGATRDDVIRAIGRGVASVAIHELIHLFLPQAPIDGSEDPLSYEYGYAGRRERYYGGLRWGFTKAALLQELGTR